MTTKAPTIEQEMARFKGFTSEDGKTVESGKENLNGSKVEITSEERAAGARLVSEKTDDKGAARPAKVELTEAESEAALTAAREKLEEGEELTTEEETEVLAAALAEKRTKAKPTTSSTSDRVKRAQDGRRRAEARAARAEGKVSDLEARLARLERGEKTPLTTGSKDGKSETVKEPNPQDFDLGELDPKYIRALVRYENEQAEAERSQKQEKTNRDSSQERDRAKFQARPPGPAPPNWSNSCSTTRKLVRTSPIFWRPIQRKPSASINCRLRSSSGGFSSKRRSSRMNSPRTTSLAKTRTRTASPGDTPKVPRPPSAQ